MPCYHPLTAYDVTPKYFTCQEKRKIVFSIANPDLKLELKAKGRELQLPCGQCVGCRLEYSRQWANRCMLELEHHDSAYFVTLTYDDAHVPKSWSLAPPTAAFGYTGEVVAPAMTLRRRDFTLFMKQLRYRFPNDNIRYFASGEYGTSTLRPHYHAIIFGLHLDDLEPYTKSSLGYQYFNSPSLSRCWIDGATGESKGYVVVGRVTWDTCAYTARYIMKKQKGPKSRDYYFQAGLEAEFSAMSRRPGIAAYYYQEHPEIWRYDKINVCTPDGGRQFTHPLYLRRMFELDEPLESFAFSERRRLNAIDNQRMRLTLTDKDYAQLLADEEEEKINRIKALTRDVI